MISSENLLTPRLNPSIKPIFSGFAGIAGLLILLALPARAFTVQELSVDPNEIVTISVTNFYTGGVYAGINKLIVNGTPENGFCIDPFHFSLSSSAGYQFVPLALGPKSPGTMGATKATELSDLWAMDYSPNMTAQQAAGLQIAIWEIVGGSNFSISGNDYGASALIQDLANYHGKGASVIAVSGPGQDYIIHTPDSGATITLLALALVGLAAARICGTREFARAKSRTRR